MAQQLKLKSTIKFPTSLIVNGVNNLGLELAESLLEQGGYVILVDTYSEENSNMIMSRLRDNSLVSFIDYAAIPHLEEDLRRLDYVFYFSHQGQGANVEDKISTQSFLKYSNYLDTVLSVASQFEAKFLLTTSIRAHLKLMDDLDIEVNYGKSAATKHTVYTDMEMQRYAESLTVEYVNKAGLDARIIRLGEIIGDGMDFSKRTNFTNLVVEAVIGNELELTNDGLESEWYIHLLDASYGLIRAQFTKGIQGEIYSLCYENAISDLSLAYKLQELEPNANEIKFVQEDKKLAPLKLHKPAPNLSRLGWKPRVSFEQAVSESIIAAKQLGLENQSNPNVADDSLVGKLRSFLSIAQQAPPPVEVEDSGPVSRLISERKQQEAARQQALEVANQKNKAKRSKRKSTRSDKLRNWFYRNFFDSRTNFPILRKVTPAQFFLVLGVSVLFLATYFAYISPAVVIARDVILIQESAASLRQAAATQDIKQIEVFAEEIKLNLIEVSEMLSRFTAPARLVAADAYIDQSINLADAYAEYLDAVQGAAYANVPLQEYLDVYTSNVSFRPSSENYLTITSDTDFSVYLDDLNTRKVYAELGAEELERSLRELQLLDINFLPAPLRDSLGQVTQDLLGTADDLAYSGVPLYISDLLGGRLARTYLVLLMDNTRPMPVGGSLSAYMLVTVQNGSISEVRLQSINDFSPDMSDLATYAKEVINLNSYSTISEFKIEDITRINDFEVFADVAADTWSQSFSLPIDTVVMLNYESLSDIIGVLDGVNVEGQPVSADNMLSALVSLQSENSTISRRNDIAAQIFAKTIEKLMENYQGNLIQVLESLNSETKIKNVIISQSDLEFNEVVQTQGLYGDLAKASDMPIKVGIISDTDIVSPTRYPSYVQNLEVTINANSSMNVRVLVKFPAIANIDQLSLCVPLVAKEISVAGVTSSRVRSKEANNQKCSVVDVVNETEISFEWDTIQFESSSQSEYNLSIGQSKLSGTQVTSNVEVSLAPSLSFSDIRPSVTSIGGKIAITEELQIDQIIELDITK